jgi:hypothetical protein
MKNFFDKKTKLLLHKLGYLRLEIESKKSELQEYETEFNRRYSQIDPVDEQPSEKHVEQDASHKQEIIDENNSDETIEDLSNNSNDEEEVSRDIEACQSSAAPDDIKKLWKQIAVKTHPDRTSNDPTLTEIYMRALSAYNNGEFDEIVDIALQLFIAVDSLSDETLKKLEQRVEILEKDLSQVNNSVLWEWAKASDEKKTMIENMLRNYRKIKKSR